MKKLNLGCGFDKKSGWVNADRFSACDPDIQFDLEKTPWPLPNNEFDIILLKHVLEHVGQSYEGFKSIVRELYRISKHNGLIEIHVPHFRHDTFWSDPTHVRAFTLLTFEMLSKENNEKWISQKANYSMLALDMGVDFRIEKALQIYDNAWIQKEMTGQINRGELRVIANERWNVIREMQIVLKTVKPSHGCA